ncbi:acyl dehydratase [Canibacter sp. lx-72]|uniref:MaoC/PaaZ C-terminal domain-containing protein n=1 Tax=Canibacter zhuwentaonis TaxID=2837491 RepID=UPI001BDC795B|nr:MaoC/PaaZ C-terminal domain-containing protein [Canibacter zhuwentaonis]MBT1018414.1 acyl dehydratase [Canibacter zhuwentaonis]
MKPEFESLTVDATVLTRDVQFSRDTLVRYAGASGDFNPIHYRDDYAQRVGLDGVLAHGMLTMGAANSVVLDWLGGAGWIADTQTRFSRPVWVDAERGATVTVSAKVRAVDADAKRADFLLQVSYEGKTALVKAIVTVQFV